MGPNHAAGGLKRVAKGVGFARDGHATHGLEGELDGLFERWGLLELETHAFFAQVNELAPIVLAKEDQDDPTKLFSRARTPLVGSPIVVVLLRDDRFSQGGLLESRFGVISLSDFGRRPLPRISLPLGFYLVAPAMRREDQSGSGWPHQRGRNHGHPRAFASRIPLAFPRCGNLPLATGRPAKSQSPDGPAAGQAERPDSSDEWILPGSGSRRL